MEITEQQSRQLYAIFTIMFAVNLAYTIWNLHEQHKLREIEKKLAEEKIKAIQGGNGVVNV
jgi:hypothetical protein